MTCPHRGGAWRSRCGTRRYVTVARLMACLPSGRCPRRSCGCRSPAAAQVRAQGMQFGGVAIEPSRAAGSLRASCSLSMALLRLRAQRFHSSFTAVLECRIRHSQALTAASSSYSSFFPHLGKMNVRPFPPSTHDVQISQEWPKTAVAAVSCCGPVSTANSRFENCCKTAVKLL